jgi:hypothetical protein
MGFETPVRRVLERRPPVVPWLIVTVVVASVALMFWKPWQDPQQPAAAPVASRSTAPVASAGSNGVLATSASSAVSPAGSGSTPRILVGGVLAVPQTWEFDLDTGRLAESGPANLGDPNDIWFEAVTNSDRYLVPLVGGGIAAVGAEATGYAGCLTALAQSTQTDGGSSSPSMQPPREGSIPVTDLRSDSSLCVRTNEGRVSEFWLENPVDYFQVSPLTIVIRYRTWATTN